jgi:hypothetical protein
VNGHTFARSVVESLREEMRSLVTTRVRVDALAEGPVSASMALVNTWMVWNTLLNQSKWKMMNWTQKDVVASVNQPLARTLYNLVAVIQVLIHPLVAASGQMSRPCTLRVVPPLNLQPLAKLHLLALQLTSSLKAA